MKASSDLLIWDCQTCQSKSIDFIPELQRIRKAAFGTIVVIAPDPRALPAALGDLCAALPIVVRFGPSAIHDAIVDIVGALASAKRQANAVVITSKFPLWVTLFQRLEPKSVLFISDKDPNSCLELSFFPQSVPLKALSWPSLSETRVSGQADLIDLAPAHAEEEDGSDNYAQEGSGEDEQTGIEPLANLEKYEIDLRSPGDPVPSHQRDPEEVTPKRAARSHEEVIQIPVKFQPLVEAMKAIGKSLISLNDLEGQLKIWSTKLNVPIDNINAYISKATDAQIVIYDKAINYVRFRNRSIATSKLEYV
jgi:hypothetical protein